MAINLTAAGLTGTHTFTKTNVNADEDFIYYSNRRFSFSDPVPTVPVPDGKGFIYREDAGSVSGLTAEEVYYANVVDEYTLQFEETLDGAAVDLGAATGGATTLDDPIVANNILATPGGFENIQAVRYLTGGAPLDGLTSGQVYFLKTNFTAPFAGDSSLYDFTAQTFGTGGSTGRTGPTLAQARSEIADPWGTQYLNMTTQGIQEWTVPTTGTYSVEVAGARGGLGSDGIQAGRGVILRGTFTFEEGEVVNLLVGQIGLARGGAGGGGGTFVWKNGETVPLIVAGGGGGAGDRNTGSGTGGDARTLTSGGNSSNNRRAGGTNGNGGQGNDSDGDAGAGAGWFTNGFSGSRFGIRPLEGGFGGNNGTVSGGFGGGGAESTTSGSDSEGAGGGGGYSGGGASANNDSAGGGGGSFVATEATNVSTTDGNYDGSSTFNGQSIGNIGSYNNSDGYITITLVQELNIGVKFYESPDDASTDTDPVAIAPNGNSYHAILPIQVGLPEDTIYSKTPHSYSDSQPIIYNFSGTAVGGLAGSTVYYARVIDNFSFQLSLTPGPSYSVVNMTSLSSEVDDNFAEVVVDTNLNILTISNHGFLVNQPIQYLTNGNNPIVPLQNQVTYYVKEVLNSNQIKISQSLEGPEIDFTDVGTGTNHSFIFVTVNSVEDSLYIPSHQLVSGQTVVYSNGGGATIPGLVNNATYYVLRVDPNIIKLSENKSLTSIADITGPGTGTQSLTVTSIDLANDTVTIPAHGFSTGELVDYDSRGASALGGLTSGNPYYVIVVDGDNIKFADTPNNATIGSAIDLTSLGVGSHVVTSLTRTPDGTYEVNSVPNATTFTAQAPGIVPPIVKTFTPRLSLNIQENALDIPSHGFITGTKVNYDANSNTAVVGLTDGNDYYVIVINRDWLQLASTADNALSGIPITLSDFGTGADHTFTSTQISGNLTGAGSVSTEVDSVLVNGTGTAFSKILKVGDNFRLFPPNNTTVVEFTDAGVSTGTEEITATAEHGLSTGDAVKFSAEGNVAPAPLVDGYWYWFRSVDADTFTLHGTLNDAQLGTNPIDLSTTGSGTFNVTKIVPVTPIVRKITAIGSDTQITVDRSYTTAYSGVSYSYPTVVYVRPQGYSLHRPFDGGVEMSVGSGTSYGTIIRQTRKYFRYQSGKGIQTSAGINFKPTIDIESAKKDSPTTILVTTRRPHGLKDGLFIEIREALDSFGDPSSVYNGRFQVTVVDELQFRVIANNPIVEDKAYGFPSLYVEAWTNGAIRSGMFDDQNGMFYEFDGQKLYAVRRSSTQQIAGTCAALQGSEFIFGTNTSFASQLKVGDYVVLRGQSYKVTSIIDDEQMTVRPEYKGRSGTEKEFDPSSVVNTSTDSFQIIGHGYTQNLPIIYNSIDGTPVGGLINGRTYYVDVVDSNNFRLKASPTAAQVVDLSSSGAGNPHSFVPAKTGIIGTLTVDTRVPQEEFSIDPVDGSGITGYDIDLSRIQMVYIDYSWYGAGKIRFGFKTTDGQVQYVHEFVHNNKLNESYFRSGNLPGRYEIATFENPTYIPFLFHWGTSVMMDGRFDDDNAYQFTASSQTLTVGGTTPKAFGSTQINTTYDYLSIPSHGFATGDAVQFLGTTAGGIYASNVNNPSTEVYDTNTRTNLTNESTYYVRFLTADRLTLHQSEADADADALTVASYSRASNRILTINTNGAHGLSTGDRVLLYNPSDSRWDFYVQGVWAVTVTDSDTFTVDTGSRGFRTFSDTGNAEFLVIKNAINYLSSGQSQDTYFLYPGGTLNNTSGANYQPLLSIRLSPSVSEGLTGSLGERDVLNRMQLRLKEVGVQTNQLVDVKLLLNGRLNNLAFRPVASPSLVQVIEHTANDTISGGIQVYSFKASGQQGLEQTTNADIESLFELSNSILGGDSVFPDGPDVLTIAVARLTGNETTTSSRLSWTEAQA